MTVSRLFARRIQSTFLLIVIAFFGAGLFYAQSGSWLTTFSYSDNSAFYKGKDGVALTFNIGWGDENAEKVLAVLEQEKYTNATFFLSGSWAERHQHIVEEIVARHYEVGLLGYEYKDYTELTEKEMIRDIAKAQTALEKMDVPEIRLMRTPTGDFNADVIRVAKKMGLTLVQWSINTNDWQNPGSKKIIEKVSGAENGDVILLHASDSALQTAKSLPEMIAVIRSKGLRPMTVSEMLGGGEARSKEIK